MNEFYNQFKNELLPVNLKLNKSTGKKESNTKPWKHGEIYADKDFKTYNSIAMRTGSKTYNVIDVDTKDTSKLTEPWRSWVEDRLMFEDATIVETANGYHFYFRSDFKIRTVNKVDSKGTKVPFIDFRGEGGIIFIYSDTNFANYNLLSTDETDVEDIIELLPQHKGESHKHEDYDEDMHDLSVATKANETLSDEEVIALFKTIPTSFTDGTEWLKIGMSLYDRFEGDDTGLNIWTEYCKRCYDENPNNEWAGYLDKDIAKWKQGFLIPDRVTYKHLLNYSTELVGRSLLQDIKKAQSEEELKKIIKETSKMSKLNERNRPDHEVRESLAKEINNRYKELKSSNKFDGRVVHASTILKAMQYEATEAEVKEKIKGQTWLERLVFVESFSNAKYYLLDTGEKLSADGANGRLSKQLNELRKEMGLKSLNVQTLVKMGMIRICSNHEYNPVISKEIFKNAKGGMLLNTYDGTTRPAPATEYTKEGLELINKFIAHFKLLMSEEEANILLDWLAWTAQNFGKKVLWTPLIQSEEGLGKSLIGTIMINHVFGEDNSGTVDSTVIVAQQTSWATKGVFKVLEEIKLAGHNRFEVLNQLKPFITNHTVSRVEKYEASSEVPNFVNFIAFTNYVDAIPVTGGDRRWWVVFSRQSTIEALEKEVGMGRWDYFAPLHELSELNSKHGAEFHKYLLERDVSEFNYNFPPKSLHKDRMRATEDSKTPYLTELEHLIATPRKGVTSEVVSTRQLKTLMEFSDEWEHGKVNNGEITTLLRKLGFIKFPKQIKSNGQVHSVWFKEAGLDDTQVRDAFHESMKLNMEDGFDDLDMEEL